MNKAVFFDRDGTINIDPGYIGNPDLVELLPGVPEGLNKLKKQGFLSIVISNQSGVARGFFTEKEVIAVNSKINLLLKKHDAGIDSFYFCPYHPDFNSPEECECRKPSPKMVLQACMDFNIDLKKSYFVGDMLTDIECGINAGLKTVLICHNKTAEEISNLNKGINIPNFLAISFVDACNYIINDFTGGN